MTISASGQKPLPCLTRVLLVLPHFSLSWFASEKFNVYTCAASRLSICSLYSCAYNDLLCMLCITVCNNFLIHLCTYPHRFGFCDVVISDQGREFVNQVETELLGLTGTQHCIATAYHTLKQTGSPRDSTRLCSQHHLRWLTTPSQTGITTSQQFCLPTEPAFRRPQSSVHLS